MCRVIAGQGKLHLGYHGNWWATTSHLARASRKSYKQRRKSNPNTLVDKTSMSHNGRLRTHQDSPYSDLFRMVASFILIPGRTSRQGCGINEGKFNETYQQETHLLQVAPSDMEQLGLTAGDTVRLTSDFGQAEVPVIAAKRDELPAGLLFIAYGDISSRLMGGDTHGSGMPTSKGLDVELEIL